MPSASGADAGVVRSTTTQASDARNRSASASISTAGHAAPNREASASITSDRQNTDARSVNPAGPARSSNAPATPLWREPVGRGLVQTASCLRRAEPDRFGLGPPEVEQRVGVDLVVLGLAGLQGGDLRGPGRGVARLGQHFRDLGSPLRERLDHLSRHSDDVRVAVRRRPPLDAHPGGQQVAEVGLIEVARSLGMLEQAIPGDGPPHRPLVAVDPGHVRHHHMGVQQRITRPARPMIKRRSDHPVGLDLEMTTLVAESRPRTARSSR